MSRRRHTKFQIGMVAVLPVSTEVGDIYLGM